MRALMLMLALLLSGNALAHKASDSYLTLQVRQHQIAGQWDIALRDLEDAIGLDDNGDGQLTWGEIRHHQPDIVRYAQQRLALRGNDKPCTLQIGTLALTQHVDGIYSALPLSAICPQRVDALAIEYRLLFDIDSQHRGLASVTIGDSTQSLLFSPEQPRQDLRGRAWTDTVYEFLRQGTIHIWTGYDHILFLLSLLLPSVLVWRERRWQAADSLRLAMADVARIVTAFTVAHSLTLTLAALGLVRLESRWVESAIAASVILAALNNLYPFIRGRRWMVAFGFGLIHGFGFASVLAELQLPRQSLALALASFNGGVEIGQLAIVAAFVPLAYLLRPTPAYRQLGLMGGSLAIIGVASIWLVERLFDTTIW